MTTIEQTQQEENMHLSFGVKAKPSLAVQFYSLNPKLMEHVIKRLSRLDKITYKEHGNIYFEGISRDTNKEIILDIPVAFLLENILEIPSDI